MSVHLRWETDRQSDDTPQLPLDKAMCLLESQTEARMTQRQLHNQKLSPAWVIAHENWNLGGSLHHLQAAGQKNECVPGSSAGLSLVSSL